MNEKKPIIVGSVVKYADGWYKVKSLWKKGTEANLTGVWGGQIYHKRVPVTDLVEDEDNWYANWSKSEHYQSM